MIERESSFLENGAIARYWTDNALGAVTRVVIWTSANAPATFNAGMSTDASGDLTSVTMARTNTRLNVFNVATDAQRAYHQDTLKVVYPMPLRGAITSSSV